MVTSRTLFWRFFAYEVVTADKTLPCDVVIAFPYGARFHLIQISLKSLLMVCFNLGDGFVNNLLLINVLNNTKKEVVSEDYSRK